MAVLVNPRWRTSSGLKFKCGSRLLATPSLRGYHRQELAGREGLFFGGVVPGQQVWHLEEEKAQPC